MDTHVFVVDSVQFKHRWFSGVNRSLVSRKQRSCFREMRWPWRRQWRSSQWLKPGNSRKNQAGLSKSAQHWARRLQLEPAVQPNHIAGYACPQRTSCSVISRPVHPLSPTQHVLLLNFTCDIGPTRAWSAMPLSHHSRPTSVLLDKGTSLVPTFTVMVQLSKQVLILTVFRQRLKTELFLRCFGPGCVWRFSSLFYVLTPNASIVRC